MQKYKNILIVANLEELEQTPTLQRNGATTIKDHSLFIS